MGTKKKVSSSVLGLLRAGQNFMRVSENYHKLAENQRHVEKHNFDSKREALEFEIDSLIDARARQLVGPAVKRALTDFIDNDFTELIQATVEAAGAAKPAIEKPKAKVKNINIDEVLDGPESA